MQHPIRLGTLVNGNANTTNYIKNILSHGFESFSITFWQTTKGFDFARTADEVNKLLEGTNVSISSLAMFGNPLESGELDLETLKGWRDCIEHAHLFNCDIIGGFTGRTRGKPIHESIPRFKEVWQDLGEKAGEKKLRIAFENCAMGGTWKSGDWNLAHAPKAWELLFNAVPLENLGLEWEPCHQHISLIDPMPQLREWVHKIFHVHGKDANVHWDVIRKYGVYASSVPDIALPKSISQVPPFAYHRFPGLGDSDWKQIISVLMEAKFKGSIDIEGWHDPVYNEDLEMTGQVNALNYLKQCRGNWVINP